MYDVLNGERQQRKKSVKPSVYPSCHPFYFSSFAEVVGWREKKTEEI